LPAWVLLIVIAGLLITQVATLSIISRDRRGSSEILELYRLNDRALSLVKLLYSAAPADRQRLAADLSNPAFVVDVSTDPIVETSIPPDETFAEMEDIMVDRLTRYGIVEARVRRDEPEELVRRHPLGHSPDMGNVQRGLIRLTKGFSHTDRLTAAIEFKDGQWLNFSMPMTPLGPILTLRSLPLYLAIALAVVGMSIWALRRLTAPYRTLEAAVRRIGADLKSPPLPEKGSREYRLAAHAINAMQSKLTDYFEDREQLAAALAHDLRTPLTRMRLRLELIDNREMRAALGNDLGEIDAIARSVIDFATMQYSEEEEERIDVPSLIESLVDGYPEVTFARTEENRSDLVCRARPMALKRCIANLLDNAVTYGGKARAHLVGKEEGILLTIVDEGPGIPPQQIEAVLRPFVRLEGSRNRRTGGSGLGLTIASTFAREMGGTLELRNEPEGGLRVALTLPRA
jgi:signal transduction histidine kinase